LCLSSRSPPCTDRTTPWRPRPEQIDAALAERTRRLGTAFAEADLQDLRVDYTRLFLGPVAALARPYGSVWLEGPDKLIQDSTKAVLALYADGGFDTDDDFRDVPDHVAAELEFLYLTLFREADARLNGDGEARAVAIALRRRLLSENLGRRAPPFLRRTSGWGAGAVLPRAGRAHPAGRRPRAALGRTRRERSRVPPKAGCAPKSAARRARWR
jgi:TorA maturation chaperone TorD